MSSGDKTETTVQNNAPPEWSIPHFKDALQRASDVSNQQYQGYDGSRIAGFSDDQEAGFDMVRQNAQQGSGLSQQANDYATRALSGQGGFSAEKNPYRNQATPVGNNRFAGENPYLGQMIGDAQQDITKSYTDATMPNMLSQFQSAGAFGGSAMQQAMTGSQDTLAG